MERKFKVFRKEEGDNILQKQESEVTQGSDKEVVLDDEEHFIEDYDGSDDTHD